uniref:G-protein coupled receptors family 1 profile domain-containing protein n=1 Tax=Arion vulgaris TaxID=1028688 RepID=A0A0B7A5M7_9EUPU
MDYQNKVLIGIYISSSILIIAANLAIIAVILYSPLLRKKARNHIIVSIALADLLLGSFVLPMLATNLIDSSAIADCHTHIAVQIIGDYGILFVVGWQLVTFNILHIQENSLKCNWNFFKLPTSACLKSFILVSWSWFAALCILVPLITTSAPVRFAYNISDDFMCMMLLPKTVLIAVCVFSLYLPYYLCVCALITIVVCYSKGCHKAPTSTLMENLNPDAAGEVTEQQTQQQPLTSSENPLVAAISNTVYLVCYTPLVVHIWLYLSEIYTPNSVNGMIVFGTLARSIILPLSWVAFKDIQEELKDYKRKLKVAISMCASNPLPSTASSVSFSRLQETQSV